MLVNSVTELIGNTPLLKLPSTLHGIPKVHLYVKLEMFNPWGSVKDRTAWGMLFPNLDELSQKKVLESSSGNTAKALQMIASINGSSLKTITNRIKVPEARDILQLLGATIEELPGISNCYDPNDPNDPLVYIEREQFAHPNEYIYTNQYFNEDNRDIHYETTGVELLNDLPRMDYLFGGLGTTGSLRGITERVRERDKSLATVGIVAAADDFIPGIRNMDEMLEVGLFERDLYADIETVNSRTAVLWMHKLIKDAGVLAGPTTGAALAGVIQYFKEHPVPESEEDAHAVFIACDRVEWYMSYIKARVPELFTNQVEKPWYETITSDSSVSIAVPDLAEWQQKHDPLIVDLRRAQSFKRMKIAKSLNFPFDELAVVLSHTNPFPTDRSLLFVCPVGEKSELVASQIQSLGGDAYSVAGGFAAWQAVAPVLKPNHE